jgi:uncharacterized protein (TIGR00255 family)
MIQSMTGFGRASVACAGVSFDIEMRAVNHRYLDLRIRVPRWLAGLESEVRARVGERFSRGKIDLNVVVPEGGAGGSRLEVDAEAARSYLAAARALRESDAVEGSLDVASLLGLPGVARVLDPQPPEEELRREFGAALSEALDAAAAMRATEGTALDRELRSRLESVVALTDAIAARSGTVQESVRERLRKRAASLREDTGIFDEARLHQEIVIHADRLDITEEIVRLRSHISHFGEILDAAGPGKPAGRRLDFLMQEFGREANTVGSKGSDAPIAHHVVELKTELERIREQVQNVE